VRVHGSPGGRRDRGQRAAGAHPAAHRVTPSFDYVTVGHVTRDALEHPRRGVLYRVGGSAFYSGLQAARLGLRTLIVTQGVPSEIEELLAPYRDELELRVIPAEQTTTLSTRGTDSARRQGLLAWAGPMREPIAVDTGILHIAPVARETPTSWQGRPEFVGLTPQGLVRSWREDEGPPLVQLDTGPLLGDIPTVPPASEALPRDISAVALRASLLPERFDAAVIAEHECPDCRALFSAAARHGASIAVTAGARPTTVHVAGGDSIVQTPFPPVTTVSDEIGAGDVFAGAYFVALAEGRAPLQAAVFANGAASARISGEGPNAIARREEILSA
ncbi:MAG: PfkB family carbohydrate kinase, partial [Solirubrobacteraceae bacterium]